MATRSERSSADPGGAAAREARLAQLVDERTRELTTLLRISRDVTSNLSVESVLNEILDKLKTVVEYSNATIVRRAGDSFYYVADQKAWNSFPHRGSSFPVSNFIDQKVMAEMRPLIIGDVHHDQTEVAVDFRRQAGEVLNSYYAEVRTWMRVPLISRGEVVGMLTLHHNRPNHYTDHHADLAMAFAEYAAIAMENARLFETLEKRTSELASLLNVARTVTSTLDLESLLTIILDQLRQVVEYELATIRIIEGDDLVLVAAQGGGLPALRSSYPWASFQTTREILAASEPRFVPDLGANTPLAEIVRKDLEIQTLQGIQSWMGIPLVSRERSIGLLSLAHTQPGFYNGSRVDLVNTFALQAAIAIENARFYEQAQALAALEERQKLARELHDSVSQALYGIALGARTARILLERDPAAVDEPLDYIASLAEAGLAEMRALIFELRPESLQAEGLVAALTKRAEAMRTRHQIAVAADFCAEPDISLDIKEALYRVGQEAMHNVVKHARASRMDLRLREETGALVLTVSDDGQGFNPEDEFPGHLGLRSMRERIEKIGGVMHITSSPEGGTRITVRIDL
ncbi:MAG TPA: GAF domain-containing sensor histidine kinase [Anaerolineales bacterium]|nr:GAF domain-containing sensor histidine kinase [Anaerolineales bacterium]